jgi:TP901 family phage tail tape measure protein
MANKVGSLYFTLGVDATEFEKKLNGASARLADFGKKAQDVGRQMSMSLTLPLAAIGGASAKMAMDFEASMAQIQGLVGIGSEEVRQMGVTAREMAKEMGKSANEAAQALYFITSAGVTGAAAIDTLEMSLKASAVGLGETQVIADLVTSALNAYGTANISAAEATDVMVASVREGKIEADQLADSMGRVLPIASQMGVSFNEVGATFAALSRTGTDASEAATQMRGILSSLLNPSQQAREQLKLLDLTAQGIRDTIRNDGLLAALEMLTQKFEGNDEAAGIVFGNIRALSGVLDLFGANVDVTRQIFENMTDSTGALSAAFAVTEQTAKFKLNKAIEESKDGMLELGQAILISLAPVLEQLTQSVKQVTTWFSQLQPETKEMIVRFGLLATAIGPVIFAVGKLSVALAFLMANPITLLIAGAVALAVAIKNTKEPFEQIVAITGKAAETITAFRNSINSVTDAYDNYISAKKQAVAVTKEEQQAIVDGLNAKRAELVANRQLAEGLLAANKARYAGFRNRIQGGEDLSRDELREMRLLRGENKELEASINDARHAEIELGYAIKDAGTLTIKTAEATETYSAANSSAAASVKELTDAQKQQIALGNQLQNLFSGKALEGLTKSFSTPPTGFFESLYGQDTLDGIDELFAKFQNNPIEGFQEALLNELATESVIDKLSAISNAFGSMSQSILGSLNTANAGWLNFIIQLGVSTLKLIAAYKAQATAAAAAGAANAGAATGPGAIIFTPVFMATALAQIAAVFGSIPKFAKGGAVTGPTLAMVGENPASRGEAIIPFERMGSFLSQFTGMGGGVQQVVVTGQIAGDTIRLSNQKSGINNGRVRWERGTGRALVN